MNLRQNLEPILSNREIEVVLKRLNNKPITQTESNYLSRSIRPKLESAEFASNLNLLSLLDYRRKKYERNELVLKKEMISSASLIIKNIKAIILFGSYIRNNHTNYRDIDVLVIVNNNLWNTSSEKHKLKEQIEKNSKLKLDINIITKNQLEKTYPYSPLLQTQIENSKIIYGKLNLKNNIIIDKAYLSRKLLEIEPVIELGKNIDSSYIYNAIRNCLSMKLFLKKIVSNKLVIKKIENNLGKTTANALRKNKANKLQREISLKYLAYIYKKLSKLLK